MGNLNISQITSTFENLVHLDTLAIENIWDYLWWKCLNRVVGSISYLEKYDEV